MRKEIEMRLIKYSASIYLFSDNIKNNSFSANLMNQLQRSTTSAALNYGEAQSAESKKDFIHKLSVVLKELRESDVNLKIIKETNLVSKTSVLDKILEESNQLVSIFYRMVQTAKANQKNVAT